MAPLHPFPLHKTLATEIIGDNAGSIDGNGAGDLVGDSRDRPQCKVLVFSASPFFFLCIWRFSNAILCFSQKISGLFTWIFCEMRWIFPCYFYSNYVGTFVSHPLRFSFCFVILIGLLSYGFSFATSSGN